MYIFHQGCSYSVVNTHKSMLVQTLPLLGVKWDMSSTLLSRLMKGFFNSKPPKPRYLFTWDVSKVLSFLKTLFPLEGLSLKMLTLKLVALLALTSASRVQSLQYLNVNNLSISGDKAIFLITSLEKTSRRGKTSRKIELLRFHKDERLCVVKTLEAYVSRTLDRQSSNLFVSYKTLRAVTTSTIARWLKEVLFYSGIDSSFTAHSFRGASTSAALMSGVQLADILRTADWSRASTFRTYYSREVIEPSAFASGVLDQ